MRVITGIARGKRLRSLEGNDVRPTTDKVKEGIFSAIQFDIEGRRFLDMFAGSGQMGIEALSRGAESAVFIDSSPAAIKICTENVDFAGFLDSAKILKRDSIGYVSATAERFDIAFLDPPYEAGILLRALDTVTAKMSDYGIIICEHPSDVSLPDNAGNFTVYKVYRYGKINVTVYRKG